MVFFRLGRPVQIALVGAALAAAPGCGSSGDDRSDADADADVPAEAEADADAGTDADSSAEAEAEADADVPAEAEAGADADGDVDLDTWEVVDPPPAPMCADVPSYTLTTVNLSSDVAKATAQVTLIGAVRPFGDPCPTLPCLAVTPDRGLGTVDGISMIDGNTARFTYNNAALSEWDPVRLDLVWTLTCTDAAGSDATEAARSSVWACRDAFSDSVSIVNSLLDCPSVVDPPPPPMAKATPGAQAAGGGFRLQAGPERDGALRLRVDGPVATYRWTAVGGTLEPLSAAEAVFRLDPRARTSLVQVAGLLPGGVSVQVFRRHRG